MTQLAEPEIHPYRWLKRATAATAVLLLLLLLAWLLWWWHANRQLDLLTAELRSAGQPLTLSDFPASPLPPAQDGTALLIDAAAQANGITVPSARQSDRLNTLPCPRPWHDTMEKAAPATTPVVALIRQARQRGGVNWQPHWPPEATTISARHHFATGPILTFHQLARVLGDTALYHHFNGNDHEAIATILDLQYVARAHADRGFLFTALFSAGAIDSLASHNLHLIAAELKLPDGERGQALRRQITQIIADLSGNGPAPAWCQRALRDDIAVLVELGNSGSGHHLFAPMARIRARDMIRRHQAVIRALDNPDQMTPEPNAITGDWINALPLWIVQEWQVVRQVQQGLSTRRTAAVALAAALYRIVHGHYPATLDELVPAYLPALPIDPLARPSKPFAYLLAAHGQRPVIICAGADGVLQITSESLLPASTNYSWPYPNPGKSDDVYFDLSARKP